MKINENIQKVIELLCDLEEVTPEDVIYALGCYEAAKVGKPMVVNAEFTPEQITELQKPDKIELYEQPVQSFEAWAVKNMPDGVNPELWKLVKKAWDASPKRQSGGLEKQKAVEDAKKLIHGIWDMRSRLPNIDTGLRIAREAVPFLNLSSSAVATITDNIIRVKVADIVEAAHIIATTEIEGQPPKLLPSEIIHGEGRIGEEDKQNELSSGYMGVDC